jgi:enterochelin esterase-like enzyme
MFTHSPWRRSLAVPGSTALLALAMALLAACGGGGGGGGGSGGGNPPAVPAGAAVEVTDSITSAETGITYPLRIRLPAGYGTSTTRYPVIYAMDSENRYTALRGVLDATQREVILVNVAAVTPARRFVDFTLPGARDYYRFVTKELVAWVEARYRADPARRTLSGHSLSGEFVMYALYLEDPAARVFASVISEDGSFWDQPNGVFDTHLEEAARLEQAMYDRSHALPVTLVMAGDAMGNLPLVNLVYQQVAGRGYTELRTTLLSYNVGHLPMDPMAFADALEFIYGPVTRP